MKPSVYVETSVFSVLVARPTIDLLATARQQITRIWWQNDAADFNLFISGEVQLEASRGDPEMARERLEYINSLPRLADSTAVQKIADGLIAAGILPPNARSDAVHLGIAAVHKIQFLATWICRHLANGQIFARVVRYMHKIGYNPPQVYTPQLLPKVRT